MSRRPPEEDDSVVLARLDGNARYHLQQRTLRAETVHALRAITTDPYLLEDAASAALAAWQADPVRAYLGREIADVLVEAGADRARVEHFAAELVGVMAQRNRWA